MEISNSYLWIMLQFIKIVYLKRLEEDRILYIEIKNHLLDYVYKDIQYQIRMEAIDLIILMGF